MRTAFNFKDDGLVVHAMGYSCGEDSKCPGYDEGCKNGYCRFIEELKKQVKDLTGADLLPLGEEKTPRDKKGGNAINNQKQVRYRKEAFKANKQPGPWMGPLCWLRVFDLYVFNRSISPTIFGTVAEALILENKQNSRK